MDPLPLPDDPTLATFATALNELGHSAHVFDARWRLVFITDEVRRTIGDDGGSTISRLGEHLFGSSEAAVRRAFYFDDWQERDREAFRRLGPFVLFDTAGGRDELRQLIDPALGDLVDEIEPVELPAAWGHTGVAARHAGVGARNTILYLRVRASDGTVAGTVSLAKPGAGMSQLMAAAAIADLGHLERMAMVERPGRRPAAVLMADLEASSPLSRRLSTSQYFAFGRRWVRSADQCIIDNGGIVGRHAGDGVAAFFLAETAGSESAASRACIETARVLKAALPDIAARSGLQTDVAFRFGLHWGATPYVGRITTAGRTEVTALGDEVNEAARIEASATGGRTLASKVLIERLDPGDAEILGIEPADLTYTPLADLASATDKARRDAASIAVCDI
jgi:class 3 adenylate cyclase